MCYLILYYILFKCFASLLLAFGCYNAQNLKRFRWKTRLKCLQSTVVEKHNKGVTKPLIFWIYKLSFWPFKIKSWYQNDNIPTILSQKSRLVVKEFEFEHIFHDSKSLSKGEYFWHCGIFFSKVHNFYNL